MTFKKFSAALGAVLMAATLAACSGGSDGGATACGDYLDKDTSGKNDVISDYLDELGESNPSNMEIAAVRTTITAYCHTVGSNTTTINSLESDIRNLLN